MKKLLFTTAAIATISTGLAMAADMPVKAPRPAPVETFSWTGCFIGGNAGGLRAHKDWYARDDFFAPTAQVVGFYYGGHDAKSWVGGVQAGCDYQFGAVVVGIQGDYDWARASGSNDNLISNPPVGGDRSNIRSIASVTGRLGVAFDRALFYVRGGGAWERDNYETYLISTGTVTFTADETRSGWTIGGGGEFAFTNFLSVFAEYNHYAFGTRAINFVGVQGGTGPSIDIKERKSVVRVGINIRFGTGPVAAKY